MRSIGTLREKQHAQTFGDILYAHGIENEIEQQPDQAWAVWVLDDEQLATAQQHLAAFSQNPTDPRFAQDAARGRERWQANQKNEKRKRANYVDARTTFARAKADQHGFLTVGLVVICIGTFLVINIAKADQLQEYFLISTSLNTFLPEIRAGQFWRLLTPIFLHFEILHIIFNVLWLKQLGLLIERVHGTLVLLGQVLLFGVLSNLGQYITSGPYFGGMSGVVYGLFGFVWLRGKFDRSVQYEIPKDTAMLMVVWYVLCFTGIFGGIANTAHTVGFILGMAWGYASSGHWKRYLQG